MTYVEPPLSSVAAQKSRLGQETANQFGVFGRLGIARTEAKPGGAFSGDSESKNGVTWGLGGQFDFNRNIGLRAEWQRYKVSDGNVDNLSIGVLYRFQ